MRKLKIYIAYFKMKFLNEIQYKIAALAGILTQFAWGGIEIMLYSAFLKNGTSNDYTISQMSTYIWLQQAFFMVFNIWSVDNDILEQCETGNILMELVKPIDLYSIWHAKTLGRKLALFSLRFLPIVIICSMPFMGKYRLLKPSNLLSFVFFIITTILSVILLMSYIMLIYISIMKLMSSQGIKVAFQIIFEGISGALIPIAFMPDKIVKIIKFTPFYYMQNAAFNIYNGYISNTNEVLKIIILQLIWIVIFTIIGRNIMKKQLKKISVQGG